jgi:hypothetical protein
VWLFVCDSQIAFGYCLGIEEIEIAGIKGTCISVLHFLKLLKFTLKLYCLEIDLF